MSNLSYYYYPTYQIQGSHEPGNKIFDTKYFIKEVCENYNVKGTDFDLCINVGRPGTGKTTLDKLIIGWILQYCNFKGLTSNLVTCSDLFKSFKHMHNTDINILHVNDGLLSLNSKRSMTNQSVKLETALSVVRHIFEKEMYPGEKTRIMIFINVQIPFTGIMKSIRDMSNIMIFKSLFGDKGDIREVKRELGEENYTQLSLIDKKQKRHQEYKNQFIFKLGNDIGVANFSPNDSKGSLFTTEHWQFLLDLYDSKTTDISMIKEDDDYLERMIKKKYPKKLPVKDIIEGYLYANNIDFNTKELKRVISIIKYKQTEQDNKPPELEILEELKKIYKNEFFTAGEAVKILDNPKIRNSISLGRKLAIWQKERESELITDGYKIKRYKFI